MISNGKILEELFDPPPVEHKRSKSIVFLLTKQLILVNFS